MLVITLLRYIMGFVCFRAYDGFADRFLNLCTSDGISLWNIQNIGGRITACTYISDYKRIRRAAKKSGMRVICTDKKGLPFFMKTHRKRVGLLTGMILSVTVIYVLSQFVWNISVVGNKEIDSDYILDVFENHGIKIGTKISDEEIDYAVSMAMKEINSLSWATVNRKGSVAVIEVREKAEKPEMYDKSKPTNVIASEDGVILSIDILSGKEEVKPGSAVVQGDLLISGVITYRDMTEKTVHADGYVKALVRKSKTFSVENFKLLKTADLYSRNVIFFFGMRLPLGKKIKTDFTTEHRSFLEADEKLLPLGIIKEYGMNFSDGEMAISDALNKKIALFDCATECKKMLDYSEIKKAEIAEKGNSYVLYAECEQEIGKLQEIYVEKNNDTE